MRDRVRTAFLSVRETPGLGWFEALVAYMYLGFITCGAGEQPGHTRVWRRSHGEPTQSNKSHIRAPERRKRSWLEIESGGALVQSRINTYLI